MRTLAGWVGRRSLEAAERIGAFTLLAHRAGRSAFVEPFRGEGGVRWQAALGQMVLVGYNAIPVAGLIAFFIGMVLALQGAYQLEKYGASLLVVDLVAVTITREVGPLLTAIVVAGRSGSAISAEIGTMKVAEEIDALTTMGLSPIRFLVVPKFLAMIIMLPCLTLLADFLGMAGGAAVGAGVLGIGPGRFAERAAEALVLRDVVTGLVKSFVFAALVVLVGCYYGFRVRGGAEGVGKATTASVVTSIFAIIVADLVATAIFYVV